MNRPKTLQLPLLFFLIFIAQLCHGQSNYTIDQIPNPKSNGNGYVSNPDAVLSSNEVDTLNTTISGLEKKTKVEIAVVIVHDFEKNGDDFDFALNLFKKWGIGKRKANNGLLLFIAVDRKKYRFITGYGLEGLLPDAILKRIGDHYLIPAFKKGDYSRGAIDALSTISDYLAQPENKKELDQLLVKEEKSVNPWIISLTICAVVIFSFIFILNDLRKKTPHISAEVSKKIIGYDKVTGIGCMGLIVIIFAAIFIMGFSDGFGWIKPRKATATPVILYIITSFILFFRYMTALSANRKAFKDDATFIAQVQQLNRRARWYLIFSPLILIVILLEERRRATSVQRFKPQLDSKNQEMTRVDRDQNKRGTPFLSKGQIAEEKSGAISYDIWINKDKSEHKIIQQRGGNFASFSACPQCTFNTLGSPHIINLTQPSYKETGTGKKVRSCTNCGYEELIKMVVIPKLSDRESDSDSNSTGSGSSSSSSSSSDSFGGGSSGGGGAGGSW